MEYDMIWVPILKVVYSMFLGGLIGFVRELARKPAGLRTHMLVAGSASLLIVLGEIMINKYSGGPVADIIQSDPIRIMEAIITGISFLGAGTIIFRNQDETVEGLTTAASILFASAIGIGVAIQQHILGGILTLIAILVLLGIGHVERFIDWVRPHIYGEKKDD
jgi:putative Mg2+ transporter-C (MgtC) family protein